MYTMPRCLFMKLYDLAIIGAGPIGLIAARKAQDANLNTIIFESRERVGGQAIELYPEKEVVDLIDTPVMLAKDYVDLLVDKLEFNERLTLKLNTSVVKVESKDDYVSVITSSGEVWASNVIVATGLGIYTPRPMGVEGEDKYEEIAYSVQDFSHFSDKKVLILGGGDSAIDWAKMVSRISRDVYLIHRRNTFRGNINTIDGIDTITLLTPYVPKEIIGENGRLKALIVEHTETKELVSLDADYILVNYGNIPRGDSLGLESLNRGIKVDENFSAGRNIYVAGDVAAYPNKKKRILPGIEELARIFKQIIT